MFSPANQCLGQTKNTLLHVTILDEESQKPTPVRVHVTREEGSTVGLPPEAIGVMYGRNDRPEGYGYQPDSSFYVDGEFSLSLEPGKYFLTLSKGVETWNRYILFKWKKLIRGWSSPWKGGYIWQIRDGIPVMSISISGGHREKIHTYLDG